MERERELERRGEAILWKLETHHTSIKARRDERQRARARGTPRATR